MNEKVPSTSIVECFLSIILYLMPWSNNCTKKKKFQTWPTLLSC